MAKDVIDLLEDYVSESDQKKMGKAIKHSRITPP